MAWTRQDIPDQGGRIAIVTGASNGIGEVAARVLAGLGARVVLAVRDQRRGDTAREAILARHPGADVSVSLLDLADLGSVRRFAERELGALPKIDLLLNNAGLGLQSKRAVTVDGFERQFATNYLGPFALTGLLLPALLEANAPRVVAISSIAHQRGRMAFGDLQSSGKYNGSKAYSQSKLADLMFALTLDRRARDAGSRLVSVAAHPGIATTGFFTAIGLPGPVTRAANFAISVFGQDAEQGALPGLYAATMPNVLGGDYWGPDGWKEIKGAPAKAAVYPQAKDRVAQEKLWAESERLTGVAFPALG